MVDPYEAPEDDQGTQLRDLRALPEDIVALIIAARQARPSRERSSPSPAALKCSLARASVIAA